MRGDDLYNVAKRAQDTTMSIRESYEQVDGPGRRNTSGLNRSNAHQVSGQSLIGSSGEYHPIKGNPR